ncbi:class I SAM-dependent methyltransferase [Methanopyrus kandleri]|uniref:SAM-dependent methyltransferase n=2 Tax=Methanopyrus kandleri TaxID=2320 RepID=Q8TZ91_METKA|nr:class I SAM-dependent methyltransferase [Methanopyrus kandleri]AAM01263.1 SAM-dependent methyltransferase [Methanopyrus kandleri AV19]HII70815.1 SAM-dependent methyltransferase [Methanopyrus kandleri]
MIALVKSVEEYRRLLGEVVEEGDVVVELGCHRGAATRIILTGSPRRVVAVDYGKDAEEAMRELERSHPELTFVKGDAREYDTLKRVLEELGGPECDVLAVDLGGGMFPDTAFKVYYVWSVTLRPRDAVVRNAGLCEFLKLAELREEVHLDDENRGYLGELSPPGIPGRIRERFEEFKLWRG